MWEWQYGRQQRGKGRGNMSPAALARASSPFLTTTEVVRTELVAQGVADGNILVESHGQQLHQLHD